MMLDSAYNLMRQASYAILTLNLAWACALVYLFWTNELGLRLFWVGVVLFFCGFVAGVVLYNAGARREAARDVMRGFEVLPHEEK